MHDLRVLDWLCYSLSHGHMKNIVMAPRPSIHERSVVQSQDSSADQVHFGRLWMSPERTTARVVRLFWRSVERLKLSCCEYHSSTTPRPDNFASLTSCALGPPFSKQKWWPRSTFALKDHSRHCPGLHAHVTCSRRNEELKLVKHVGEQYIVHHRRVTDERLADARRI